MSVANALAFIRRVRSDAGLRGQLQTAPPRDGLATLCALADAEGLACEPAHMHEAFWIEWAARLAHFSLRTASAAGEGRQRGFQG